MVFQFKLEFMINFNQSVLRLPCQVVDLPVKTAN